MPGNDVGVVSPTAAISSIVYTPKESIAFIRNLYENYPDSWGLAGFYDALSPHYNWTVKWYLAIDQGPEVVMLENYRSGLIWKLFMNAPEIQQGLKTRIYYFKIPSEREKSSKIKFCILVLIFNVFIRDNK